MPDDVSLEVSRAAAVSDIAAIIAIVGMMIATLVTRLGGFWVMERVTITPTLEAFLRALASSVVVAAIAPAAWHGDWAARFAIVAAAAVMVVTRQAWLAMIAGMGGAAAVRLILSGM